MAPIVDGLEQQYAAQLVIKRINANTGDGPTIMRDYKLLGHPTVLIFNEQGQEVTRLLGPQKRETIEITLQQLLKSNLEVPKQ